MKKYKPSNGTEGEGFMGQYCYQCIHERWVHAMEEDIEQDKCDILTRTMIHDINDPEYPSEWTYDDNGKATCTKWQKWDWGDDDDRNEPPEKPIQIGPNQLGIFPLYTEKDFDKRPNQSRKMEACRPASFFNVWCYV